MTDGSYLVENKVAVPRKIFEQQSSFSMPIQEVEDSESSFLQTEIESSFTADLADMKQLNMAVKNKKGSQSKQVIPETNEEQNSSSNSSQLFVPETPKLNLKLIGVSRMKESLNKGDDDDIVDFFEISYQNLCLIHTYKA